MATTNKKDILFTIVLSDMKRKFKQWWWTIPPI